MCLEVVNQFTIILVVEMQFDARRSCIKQYDRRALPVDHAFVGCNDTPFQVCLKTRASVKCTEKAFLLSLICLIDILNLHARVLSLIFALEESVREEQI